MPVKLAHYPQHSCPFPQAKATIISPPKPRLDWCTNQIPLEEVVHASNRVCTKNAITLEDEDVVSRREILPQPFLGEEFGDGGPRGEVHAICERAKYNPTSFDKSYERVGGAERSEVLRGRVDENWPVGPEDCCEVDDEWDDAA